MARTRPTCRIEKRRLAEAMLLKTLATRRSRQLMRRTNCRTLLQSIETLRQTKWPLRDSTEHTKDTLQYIEHTTKAVKLYQRCNEEERQALRGSLPNQPDEENKEREINHLIRALDKIASEINSMQDEGINKKGKIPTKAKAISLYKTCFKLPYIRHENPERRESASKEVDDPKALTEPKIPITSHQELKRPIITQTIKQCAIYVKNTKARTARKQSCTVKNILQLLWHRQRKRLHAMVQLDEISSKRMRS